MSQPKVTLDVRQATVQTSVIDIHGEITSAAENILMDAFSQATMQGAHNIVLNFKDLEYMNSSGIGLLVTLLIRARRQAYHLTACGLSQHYRQIFELTRLNDAIGIFDSEPEALQALETVS
jgi:anti-sigma B factor antagonist